eukprot:g4636.t1
MLSLLLIVASAHGQVPSACHPTNLPMGPGRAGAAQIQGPANFSSEGVADWLGRMASMRTACNAQVGFDPADPGTKSMFDDPALKWTQTAYIGPQMHPYDKYFYDPSKGNGTGGAGYTVDRWLDDLNARYGGIDQALIWPTYTNIGIDDRNTWELIRSMPGGAEGVAVVVKQLQARGVKVLWPYHPWDHSTHDQQRNNETDFAAMAQLLKDTGADGFNGDTMQHIPRAFLDAAAKVYKPIALQAEGGFPEYDLPFRTIGWAEGWTEDTNAPPMVNKPKWLSFGKATTAWCARWTGDPQNAVKAKLPQVQVAFFNGLGYETWENVWGTWNGITPRDGEAIRRAGLLLRYFGRRGFLQSAGWVPFTPEVLPAQMAAGVFGSAFPREGSDETVYFLVNRNDTARSGALLAPRYVVGNRYYDCYNGLELTPNYPQPQGFFLSFTVQPGDFGCVLSTPNGTAAAEASEGGELDAAALRARGGAAAVPATLGALLATMRALTRRPLTSFDSQFRYLQQTMVDADNRTAPLRPAGAPAAGEVYVRGSGAYAWAAAGVEIEGGTDQQLSGVGEQMPWEPFPRRAHARTLQVGAMYVDTHPVTNAQYAAYLNRTGYLPADRANWLKQGFDKDAATGLPSAPKAGWENRPVTHVSLADARAYCAFKNKRLPHTWEWQYFAQGGAERAAQRYPWGDADDLSRTPALNNDYVNPGPEPVGRYPNGSSAFGVQDLVRSVWQYTTSFEDEHTRSVVLRGGSNYNPWRGAECRWVENDNGTPRTMAQAPACFEKASTTPVPGSTPHLMGGSHWYFPPAYDLTTYGKYFVMGGAYERAGTVGFRCVADAEDEHKCTNC